MKKIYPWKLEPATISLSAGLTDEDIETVRNYIQEVGDKIYKQGYDAGYRKCETDKMLDQAFDD